MIFAFLFALFIDALIFASNTFSFEISDYIVLSLIVFACVYVVFRIAENILIKKDKKSISQKKSLASNVVLTISLIILIPIACFAIFTILFGLYHP